MAYDKDNIFAKILRGEIPCDKVYDDDFVLAFKDINPKAPVHILAIPKLECQNLYQFTEKATAEQHKHFFQTVIKIAGHIGGDSEGYRILTNTGPDSGQEVEHFHVHILGGEKLKGI